MKATFTIAEAGELILADEQAPLLRSTEYFGEPGKSSVRYEAELGPVKPATEVTVLGYAHSPRAQPAECVPVGLQVGRQKKTILVFGDRVFRRGVFGVTASQPKPFVHKPIRYEQAYGGMDLTDSDSQKHAYESRNPIGCGFALHKDQLIGQSAPSITYPYGDDDKTGPAGLGPIASYWSPRLGYGGTYDAQWEKTKKPLLPDDYDERFTLCAPADQCSAQPLRGGELLVLEHLTPSGQLTLQLPKIYLAFSTYFGKTRAEHRSKMASVILEPEEHRLIMTWQTALKVPACQVDCLDETVVHEKAYLS